MSESRFPSRFLLALAVLVGGCSPATDAPSPGSPSGGVDAQAVLLSEPPVPANLESMGPRVARRVEVGMAAVRAEPGSAAAWGELGMVLEVRSLRELALVCYEQARLRDPSEARWPYRMSVTRWRLGEMEPAFVDIRRALELAPDYAPAHYRLGTLHFEQGELDPAEEAFDRCRQLDPLFAGGPVGKARVLLQRDHAEQAVDLLEPLVQRDSSDVIVTRLLQTAYRQAGREVLLAEPTEPEADHTGLWNDPFEAELNEFRERPEIHHVLDLLQAGQGAEAARLLEARRSEGRDAPDDAALLAEAYFLEGRTQDARRIYTELIAKEPKNASAYIGLARFDEFEGELQAAVTRLQAVVEFEPENALAWRTMGRLLYRGQQYEAALPVLERALELDQRSPELRLWFGESHLVLQNWAQAAQNLRVFLERDPEAGVGHLLLSKALLKLGDLEQAQAHLETARRYGSGRRGFEKLVEQGLDRARRRASKKAGS